jgi:hypothetical protein
MTIVSGNSRPSPSNTVAQAIGGAGYAPEPADAFRFDGNKYLHLLFLHDDVHYIERSGPVSHWYPPFRDSISTFIEASSKRLIDGTFQSQAS